MVLSDSRDFPAFSYVPSTSGLPSKNWRIIYKTPTHKIKMILGFDWIAFGLGAFGAFIMEFTRFIRQSKTAAQTFTIANTYVKTEKVNSFAFVISLCYIAIGGAIAGAFATTKSEAFLYGALWQALFTFVISLKPEDK